jgi:unsaturated pyranuronate lyase
MQVVDTRTLPVLDKLPGWHGRLIHADSMTFAHWRFEAGAEIHRHHHEQEEVWHVVEGELEAQAGGTSARIGPGMVLILSPHQTHAIVALSDGFAIVADHPSRREFG